MAGPQTSGLGREGGGTVEGTLGGAGDGVNRVNSTFGIPYQVLKLVGSIMSSRQ